MRADHIVIGAGIAGSSVAFELAQHGTVLLIERESQPGYHSTGRSGALFAATYGNFAVRSLTRASRAFFECPPLDFAEGPLFKPRGLLHFGDADQVDKLDALQDELGGRTAVVRGDGQLALQLAPVLRPGVAVGCIWEPDAFDIEVHGLQQGYLRQVRKAGSTIWLDSPVEGISRHSSIWRVTTPKGSAEAPVIVNAAGAWADEVAALAGVQPIGLVPKRRTAVQFDPPEGARIDTWPVAIDVDETFYIKPDAGKLMASPADETPTIPCDAQPDEWDVAVTMERVLSRTSCAPRTITHRWAGLRSFVADKTPVVGFEPDVPRFFWLAAQGGYGIQTAPALARAAAALLLGGPLPRDILAEGVNEAQLSPKRLPGRKGGRPAWPVPGSPGSASPT